MNGIVRSLSALCTALCPGVALSSETLLTIERGGVTRQYDFEALKALPASDFTTTTPWTAGPQRLTGVPVADLLQDAGIESGAIHASALNDYAVTLDVNALLPDADGHGPIVAYQMNGARMSVRDKGPLWLIWPFDAAPHFRTEVIYSGSIWQLESIRHLPDPD